MSNNPKTNSYLYFFEKINTRAFTMDNYEIIQYWTLETFDHSVYYIEVDFLRNFHNLLLSYSTVQLSKFHD